MPQLEYFNGEPIGFDTMQVCINGHVITQLAEYRPSDKKAHCTECGAKTITECLNCGKPIRGYEHVQGVLNFGEQDRPNFCEHCGQAFPWRTVALAILRESAEDLEFDSADLQKLESAISDIESGNPRAAKSATWILDKAKRAGKPAYDLAIKVFSDILSETLMKQLGIR